MWIGEEPGCSSPEGSRSDVGLVAIGAAEEQTVAGPVWPEKWMTSVPA
jgi:hypothetical protein